MQTLQREVTVLRVPLLTFFVPVLPMNELQALVK